MKQLFGIILIALLSVQAKAQPKLVKIWETTTPIDLPESVLFDAKEQHLFVAVMGQTSDTKDSIGGVAIFDLNGKVKNMDWITGMNSPKGMARHGDKLYVADITDLVIIDIPSSKIEQRIEIPGSAFLNDVTADDKGVIYVSDSKTKRIHQHKNKQTTVYLEEIDGLNGLKAVGSDLFIAGGGKNLLKADASKKLTKVAGLPHGGDGIEPIGNGDFLFSAWGGLIYYVYADGRNELLLDTQKDKINAADIGYDPVKQIVYVPTFFKNSVAAYQLSKN